MSKNILVFLEVGKDFSKNLKNISYLGSTLDFYSESEFSAMNGSVFVSFFYRHLVSEIAINLSHPIYFLSFDKDCAYSLSEKRVYNLFKGSKFSNHNFERNVLSLQSFVFLKVEDIPESLAKRFA